MAGNAGSVGGSEGPVIWEGVAVTFPSRRRHVDENTYVTDFYTWANTQAHLLRSGQISRADAVNIAEELETLGRSEARALKSCYKLVATHLLKAIYQPEKASRSWDATITEQRQALRDNLSDNPGLQSMRLLTFADAYSDARQKAVSETGIPLNVFPIDPPFSIEQAEDVNWLPPSLKRLRTERSDRATAKPKGRGRTD